MKHFGYLSITDAHIYIFILQIYLSIEVAAGAHRYREVEKAAISTSVARETRPRGNEFEGEFNGRARVITFLPK